MPYLPANATSNTASHQHQHEQEMLLGFNVPNPPILTQQLSAAAEAESGAHQGHLDAPRTLWMGDLDPWLDEGAIADLWWQILQKQVTVKVIKRKSAKPEPGYAGVSHSGYCFVEFASFDDAQHALLLNGQLLPDIAIPLQQLFPKNPDNQKKYFRLNWALGATLSAPIVQTPEFSLFVGDLLALTTEAHLLAFFQKSFPNSIKTVRVMTDPVSGKLRCFGFVRFTDELERQRALTDMNGAWFGGRPLRVALATPRNAVNDVKGPGSRRDGGPGSFYPDQGPQDGHYFMPPPPNMASPPFGFYPPVHGPRGVDMGRPHSQIGDLGSPDGLQQQPGLAQAGQGVPFTDPTNTTVFVGGLLLEVTEQTLFALFKPFGLINQVKIPPGKNCAFIKYSTREEAEEAIAAMQGFIIGGNRIRLSWGKVSASNKKFQQQQHQVAHAAQLQAAAALSMGMDPASAIAAAAAAAAAGGYQGPPLSRLSFGPPMGVNMPVGHMAPHQGHFRGNDSDGQGNYDQGPQKLGTSGAPMDPYGQMPMNPYYMVPPPHPHPPADYVNSLPGAEQDDLVSAVANVRLGNHSEAQDSELPKPGPAYGVYGGPIYNAGYPMHDYHQFMAQMPPLPQEFMYGGGHIIHPDPQHPSPTRSPKEEAGEAEQPSESKP